ncbi:hypothetical protein CERSUDRAFT_110608 [Gelatoporia subvermispora B]|uniref:Cora-domain-containing protein n=1 Tax=Ceriporiopsis subvermispora (strain B) TaxID=914234 RepID=M2RUD4_CERS8|nr:hypothetical protein CERSUDRAFT_110608 [Gelatoporia subvermispora B]
MSSDPTSYLPEFPPDHQPLGRPSSSNDDHGPGINEEGDEDIYRGEPPSPPRSPSPQSVTSSSSSSASSVFRGRLGAISAGVENAISRWARAWISTSSVSSSSSDSSDASIITMTRSQMARRRKRRMSLADLHNARSEREVAARIRAREEYRTIPRAFVLYSPRSLEPWVPGLDVTSQDDYMRRHVLHTSSLPLATTHLAAILKEKEKARRPRPELVHTAPIRSTPVVHDYMMPEVVQEASTQSTASDPVPGRRGRKGKQKAGTMPLASGSTPVTSKPSSPSGLQQQAHKAWWLDVSSPTWEDMHAIGKLLHLHPLTLEDILQQDPREKLEVFPKLGYHFIVFRAMESKKTRERLRLLHGGNEGPIDEGIIGEVIVYLVVFREGICTFHFADIAEHTDHVRHKILTLGENTHMSSDWIAHGLIDSIVDSFFPFLERIEDEVLDIENLIFSDRPDQPPSLDPPPSGGAQDDGNATHGKTNRELRTSTSTLAEKPASPHMEKTATTHPAVSQRRTRFAVPAAPSLLYRRFKRFLRGLVSMVPDYRPEFKHTNPSISSNTVHRMARTRRLVTSLTRLLALKSEVVSQVQKRLLSAGEWGLRNGTDHMDVYIYMGDVQDHILTLQQSLAHYERMLSQSHPNYLSHLRLSVRKAQSGTDKAIVTLTTVSLGVLCVQTVIGVNSMNTTLPHNDLAGTNYSAFFIVIAISIAVTIIYGALVRWWWISAKRRRRNL